MEGQVGELLQSVTERLDNNEGKTLHKIWQDEMVVLEEVYEPEIYDLLFQKWMYF